MSLQINDYKSTISFKDLFISISFKEFIKLYSLAYLPCLLTLPAYLACLPCLLTLPAYLACLPCLLYNTLITIIVKFTGMQG